MTRFQFSAMFGLGLLLCFTAQPLREAIGKTIANMAVNGGTAVVHKAGEATGAVVQFVKDNSVAPVDPNAQLVEAQKNLNETVLQLAKAQKEGSVIEIRINPGETKVAATVK